MERDVKRGGLLRAVRKVVGDAWLRAFGWQADADSPPPKGVVVAAPHTSGWDWPFTMAVGWSLGVDFAWLGKKSLFRPPFGRFMAWTGGIPVDRSTSRNMVAQVVDRLREADRLLVVVAPEGTRRGGGAWKTGFYWMAHDAGVPIVLGYLDYAKKRGGLGKTLVPRGDLEHDGEIIRAFYRDIQGKHPEKFSPIRFAENNAPSDRRSSPHAVSREAPPAVASSSAAPGGLAVGALDPPAAIRRA